MARETITGGNLGVNYVSRKVNRVCWRPSLKPGLKASRIFAAGSWDNGADNVIAIYGVGGGENEATSDHTVIAEAPHPGDVTDISFLSTETLITTSSTGRLTLFQLELGNGELSVIREWNVSPGFALTALSTKGEEVVAVGESGDIHVLNVNAKSSSAPQNHQLQRKRVPDADSFTVSSVVYLRPQEILTGNSSGQLKLWDLRQTLHRTSGIDGSPPVPIKILTMNGERSGICSLAQHPTQPHLVAAGGSDGLLTIWDMRQDKAPASLLQGHDSPVWDVKFHPSHPDHLFTCSDDGKVLHWDASVAADATHKRVATNSTLGTSRIGPLTLGGSSSSTPSSQSPWISNEGVGDKKSLIVTCSLLPAYFDMSVNSIDIESDTLICGTDAEAIFVVDNLNIH